MQESRALIRALLAAKGFSCEVLGDLGHRLRAIWAIRYSVVQHKFVGEFLKLAPSVPFGTSE